MPLVVETIEINREPSEVYPIAADYEKYPDIMENVRETNIFDPGVDEQGNKTEMVEFIANVDGRIIKWVEKNIYKLAENRIDFSQVKGDLKIMYGHWQLDRNGGTTMAEFSIYFEFGIPMLAPLVHPFIKKALRENMKQMLVDVKKKAEEKVQTEVQ